MKPKCMTTGLLRATAVGVLLFGVAVQPAAGQQQRHGSSPHVPPGAGQERTIYLAAVEPKGGATVDKEPYPPADLPGGGGYVKKAPNPATGRWEVSAYQWSPGTIVALQGDRVTLEFVGINGDKHTTHIEKYHPGHFELKRGEVVRIRFTADTPGVFEIHCKEHEPTMTGQLIVLPR